MKLELAGKIGETLLRATLAVAFPGVWIGYEVVRQLIIIQIDKEHKNADKQQELQKWANSFAVEFSKKINPLVAGASLSKNELEPVIDAAQEWFSYVFSDKAILLESGLRDENLQREAREKYEQLMKNFSDPQKRLFDRLKKESIQVLRTEIMKNQYLARTAIVGLLEIYPELDKRVSKLEAEMKETKADIKEVKADVEELKKNKTDSKNDKYQKFEQDYRQKLYNALSESTEIGLTDTNVKNKTYDISTAYISLWINYQGNLKDEDIRHIRENEALGYFDKRDELIKKVREGSDRFHKVLPQPKNKRLLIRGEAGSGKTTMLNWLAANLANRSFDKEYKELAATYGDYLPFLIRLRDYSPKDGAEFVFPTVEQFCDVVKDKIGSIPKDFIIEKLNNAKAIILIDGVDELPSSATDSVYKAIRTLVKDYPKVPIIVSSRGEAVEKDWLEVTKDDFVGAYILPMELPDIKAFVKNWYKAAEGKVTAKDKDMAALESNLIMKLENDNELRRLAETPLLCAAMCLLNFEDEAVPDNRLELYERFSNLLLKKIEEDKDVTDKETLKLRAEIVEELALEMLFYVSKGENHFAISKVFAEKAIKLRLGIRGESIDKEIKDLINRSGILRTTSAGKLEFIHRTVAEYLAARKMVAEGSEYVKETVQRIDNERSHGIIHFVVGLALKKDKTENIALAIAETIFSKTKDKKYALRYLMLLEYKQFTPEEEKLKRAIELVLPLESENEASIVARADSTAIPYLKYDASWSHEEAGFAVHALLLIDNDKAWEVIESYKDYKPTNRADSREPVINYLLGYEEDEQRQKCAYEIVSGFKEDLTRLELSYLPQINNLEGLKRLENLTDLGLIGLPELKNMDGMSQLENLTVLMLEDLPQINNLEGLKKLNNLTDLGLFELL